MVRNYVTATSQPYANVKSSGNSSKRGEFRSSINEKGVVSEFVTSRFSLFFRLPIDNQVL